MQILATNRPVQSDSSPRVQLGICESWLTQPNVWDKLDNLHNALSSQGPAWPQSLARLVQADLNQFKQTEGLPEETKQEAIYGVAFTAVDYLSRRADGVHKALADTCYSPACGQPSHRSEMLAIMEDTLKTVAATPPDADVSSLLVDKTCDWMSQSSDQLIHNRLPEEASRWVLGSKDGYTGGLGHAALGAPVTYLRESYGDAMGPAFQRLQQHLHSAPASSPAPATQAQLQQDGSELAQAVLRASDTSADHPAISGATAAQLQKQGLAILGAHGSLGEFAKEALQTAGQEDFRTTFRSLIDSPGLKSTAAGQGLVKAAMTDNAYVMSDQGAQTFYNGIAEALPSIQTTSIGGLAQLGLDSSRNMNSNLDGRLACDTILRSVEAWPETHHSPWPWAKASKEEQAIQIAHDTLETSSFQSDHGMALALNTNALQQIEQIWNLKD